MNTPQISPGIFKQSDIELAYLFGSRSKGTFVSESDFDIAILFKENANFSNSLKRTTELSSRLSKNLPTHVDIVDLNNASLLLKYEIIANGILLYCHDEKKRLDFEVKIMKEYFDDEYTRRIYNQALYERIEQGA